MEFTAVYNTKTMNGVEYSFNANTRAKAMEFCTRKFNASNIVIVNHEAENEVDRYIHLGDARKTGAILRRYIKKHSINNQ